MAVRPWTAVPIRRSSKILRSFSGESPIGHEKERIKDFENFHTDAQGRATGPLRERFFLLPRDDRLDRLQLISRTFVCDELSAATIVFAILGVIDAFCLNTCV